MMKVSNRKIISRLANASFKANKLRNGVAIMAIALTTILFTTLFTIGIGAIETFEQQTMRQSGGSAHTVMKYITEEQFNAVKDHSLIRQIGYSKYISTADNSPFLKRRLEMWVQDAVGAELRFSTPTTGKLPQAADEIAMDTVSLDLLGIPHELGQEVPLSYRMKDKPYTKNFKLSGYWTSEPAISVGFGVLSKDFVDVEMADLPVTYRTDHDMTGVVSADIMFSNSWDIEKKLEQVITDSGYRYHTEDSTEPFEVNDIEGNLNWAYLSSGLSLDATTIVSLAAAAVLIILTGYLIIFNIFHISIIKDIKFYGLLKTIGTTSRQLHRMILKQAMLLSVIGIPFGLMIGFIVGKHLLPLFMGIMDIEHAYIDVSISPIIFIGAALFAWITVYISTRKPSRIAGKVSPVEAVRYSGVSEAMKRTSKKSTDGGKLHKMAWSNLGRNRKRTVMVILSLSLGLVLLNSVFTLSKGIDMDKYLSKFVDTDYLIGHANYFNMNHFRSADDALTESFIQAVEAQPGFEEGGRIYNNVYVGDSFIRYTGDNRQAYPNWDVLLPEGEQQQLTLYGMDQLPLSRLDIIEGEKSINKLMEKLATGRYIIEGLHSGDHGEVLWETDRYKVGENVQLTVDGKEYEYEVIAKAKMNMMTNTIRSSSSFSMYLPTEEYLNIVTRPVVMTYAYNVEGSYEPAMDAFLNNYTSKTEPTMNYESKLTMKDSFIGLKNLIVNVGSILSLIIGLIGILNFMNSMLTSIMSRRQEFAIMQSIGMTNRQLRKMVIYEGLYYALATIVVSGILGIVFSYLIIGGVVGNLWFFTYQFTIVPLLLSYPLLLLLSGLIPYFSFRSINRQSVVERLRDHR